jgi:hypothetical protein
MRIVKLSLIGLLLFLNSALAEVKMGVEGGLTYADMRAEETAQSLANASGSTVTYKYDEATWQGRIFADMEVTPEVHVEIGYFLTGSLDATYTISGASATEGYNAMGIDLAAVIYRDDIFFKAGMHSSELEGNAKLTIGGTTYNVSETISGSGYLVGGGVQVDDSRFGLTYYADVGGDTDSDMVNIYYGLLF